MTARPLFITGASRSGTSMTAGLFAVHDIWFGPCMVASPINRKGFFESLYLKRHWGAASVEMKQAMWREWLLQQNAPAQWAVKAGPEWWPVFKAFNPVVVCCYRDEDRIYQSRVRAKFTARRGPIHAAWNRMADIDWANSVRPGEFVEGNFAAVMPVFRELGIPFDEQKAAAWINPEMWSGG